MIFYADDDPDDLMLFKEAADNCGLSLKCFPNGDGIMDHLQEADLLFLDINMSVRSGLEVLRAIRKENKELPIIMFSTASDQGLIVASKMMKADMYVQKPPSFTELENIITKISAIDFTDIVGNDTRFEVWETVSK